jgi:hypothetical protein
MSDTPLAPVSSAITIDPELLGTVGRSDSNSTQDSMSTAAQLEIEERGRLKRRRQSSLSPRRASSPSRGHDRTSGSRYREHHRKHHRPSSPLSSISPPTSAQKKIRRRSDAEPDHTFRGRVRNRSGSRGRTRSPILEGEDDDQAIARTFRRRSQPPSRHKAEAAADVEGAELRRQRSHHKLYNDNNSNRDRRDSKSDTGARVVSQESATRAQQLV